jgi:hypothetical protein
MENTKPKLKVIAKSKMEIPTQLKMLCKKFLWSPHGSASSWIALNNWRGLNKIPWRKYEIVWSKSITREPASAVGKSPVILPIIKPANTCVGKVIWNYLERIKKFSSPTWCAWKESNLRPRSYQERALPLSHTRLIVQNYFKQKTANFQEWRFLYYYLLFCSVVETLGLSTNTFLILSMNRPNLSVYFLKVNKTSWILK